MEIFFFWLICAVLVGVYASNKGHSGFGMFLVSVVLSPLIGFLIEAVRSPNREATEAKAVNAGEMKKCPACAELIRAEARKCRYCGEQFAETAGNPVARDLLDQATAKGRAGEPGQTQALLHRVIDEFPDSDEAEIARRALEPLGDRPRAAAK